ncbi:MAG: hypothetical protein ACRECG_15255, partial [Bradyrhizobium sp.]
MAPAIPTKIRKSVGSIRMPRVFESTKNKAGIPYGASGRRSRARIVIRGLAPRIHPSSLWLFAQR